MSTLLNSVLARRILTGVALLAGMAAIVAVGGAGVGVLCIVITAATIYELLSVSFPAYRNLGVTLQSDVVRYTAAFTLIPIGLLLGGMQAAASIGALVAILTFLREIRNYESEGHESPIKEAITSLGVVVFYPLTFGLLMLGALIMLEARFQQESWRFILWYVAIVVASDTGAYFGGRAFGRNKLSPRISPNKTVEGFIAGIVLALVVSVLVTRGLELHLYVRFSLFPLAALVSILAPIGDLAESLIKRVYNVKDMGDLLPGHGGVFDRVDSYLFSAPALFFLSV